MFSSPQQPPQHVHTNGAPYGPNAASKTSSEASLQRVKNLPGYTTPVFKEKEAQRAKVQAIVAAKVRRIPIVDTRITSDLFSSPY